MKPNWTCLQVSHLPNDVEERIWRDENGRLHVRWNGKDPWEEIRRLTEELRFSQDTAMDEAMFANEANAQVAEFEEHAKRQDEEIRRLREEREDALKLCRELTEPTHIDLHMEPGKMDVSMRSNLTEYFAHALGEIFEGTGAENCVQFSIEHPKHGAMTMTLQKAAGKTPLALKAEAEAERDAAQEENRRLREALGPFAELGAFHKGYTDVKHLASVPVEWLRRAAKAMEPQTTKPKD